MWEDQLCGVNQESLEKSHSFSWDYGISVSLPPPPPTSFPCHFLPNFCCAQNKGGVWYLVKLPLVNCAPSHIISKNYMTLFKLCTKSLQCGKSREGNLPLLPAVLPPLKQQIHRGDGVAVCVSTAAERKEGNKK